MNKRRSILMYGPDQKALSVSQNILKLIGNKVAVATNLREIHEIVTHTDQLDLLVLSHSFSKQQCGRAITITHSRWPGMRSYVLSTDEANFPETVVDEVLTALRGPVRLGSWLETLVVSESSAYSHLY